MKRCPYFPILSFVQVEIRLREECAAATQACRREVDEARRAHKSAIQELKLKVHTAPFRHCHVLIHTPLEPPVITHQTDQELAVLEAQRLRGMEALEGEHQTAAERAYKVCSPRAVLPTARRSRSSGPS